MMVVEYTAEQLTNVLLALAPMAFIGIMWLVNVIIEKARIANGAVKTYTIAKNSRIKKKLRKPKGQSMELGKDKPVPFDNKPGYMVFEGNTPVVIFDADGNQIDLSNPKDGQMDKMDKDYFSNLIMQSYNLGILAAQKEQKNEQLLLYAAVAAGVVSAALGYVNWQGIGRLT